MFKDRTMQTITGILSEKLEAQLGSGCRTSGRLRIIQRAKRLVVAPERKNYVRVGAS